jgi:type IX secretion system PorP/SprF family membrane protein
MQLQGKNLEDDILAIGISNLSYKSNNGGLQNNSFAGTISFHKVLDEQRFSRIGAGLQVAYTSKTVDYTKMTFETQFTPIGYDISLPTNEPTSGFSMNYLDYSAGIVYSYLSGDINFYGGASISHLTKPAESYGAFSSHVPMTLTLHAGGSILVGDVNTLYGSVMHMRTSLSSQTTFGLVYGFNLNGGQENDASEFLVGSWLRLKDAVVPYIGLKVGNIQGGISYDITTSQVSIANKGMGGLELSIQTILDYNPNRQALKKIRCKFVMF